MILRRACNLALLCVLGRVLLQTMLLPDRFTTGFVLSPAIFCSIVPCACACSTRAPRFSSFGEAGPVFAKKERQTPLATCRSSSSSSSSITNTWSLTPSSSSEPLPLCLSDRASAHRAFGTFITYPLGTSDGQYITMVHIPQTAHITINSTRTHPMGGHVRNVRTAHDTRTHTLHQRCRTETT